MSDDLLFFLTDRHSSLPAVVSAFDTYGKLADLKINMSKSEILNVSILPGEVAGLKNKFSFHWCESKMKYLGIWLSSTLQDLYALNYLSLMATLRSDLAAWNTKFILWMGRVAVFKMNILPRLLYLFQAVPVALPGSFFVALRLEIIKFIWAGQKSRLRISVLYRPKEDGGLALPDLSNYYRVAQLTRLVDWSSVGDGGRWLDLEGAGSVLPWLPPSAVPKELRSHPLIGTTLRLWDHLKFSHALSSSPSPLMPLTSNPLFTPRVRKTLQRHLVEGHRLLALHVAHVPTIQALTSRPDLPQLSILDRFNFSQIHHFLSSLLGSHSLSRVLSPFERFCLGLPLTH
uniref:Reverse transcriptase domain-containing protein n=1 Tax=Leptobrachium leishanense TaxID=445787 RepID=A0A8C5LV67_9ANUR